MNRLSKKLYIVNFLFFFFRTGFFLYRRCYSFCSSFFSASSTTFFSFFFFSFRGRIYLVKINKLDHREFSPEDHLLLMVVAQLAAVAIHRAERYAEKSG